MKKILIVEDDLRLWDKWLSDMSENYELVFAGTREEAEVAFADNNDISLIAMDGYLTLDLRQNDGRDLVIKFRRTFTGPMIAMSRSSLAREELMAAGCEYEIMEKEGLANKVVEILGL